MTKHFVMTLTAGIIWMKESETQCEKVLFIITTDGNLRE